MLSENTRLCTNFTIRGIARCICSETRDHMRLAWCGKEVLSTDLVLSRLK